MLQNFITLEKRRSSVVASDLSHLYGLHTFPVCVGGPVDPGTASGEYRVRHRALQALPLPTGGAPQLPEDRASHRNQERGKQLPLLHNQ